MMGRPDYDVRRVLGLGMSELKLSDSGVPDRTVPDPHLTSVGKDGMLEQTRGPEAGEPKHGE